MSGPLTGASVLRYRFDEEFGDTLSTKLGTFTKPKSTETPTQRPLFPLNEKRIALLSEFDVLPHLKTQVELKSVKQPTRPDSPRKDLAAIAFREKMAVRPQASRRGEQRFAPLQLGSLTSSFKPAIGAPAKKEESKAPKK